MFNDHVNRNYNINLRLLLNVFSKTNNFIELEKKINLICNELNVKENRYDEEINKYDTETLLYLLFIMNKFKEKEKMKDNYYKILTYLLIIHDQESRYNGDYLLTAEYILNAKKENINFLVVPHGIFLETNFKHNRKFVENIENYISVEDFLEINKWIIFFGYDIDRLFDLDCFYKNFKEWPNATYSLIYKIYFIFLQKNLKEINEIKNYIKTQSLEKSSYSASYNFIFILFAAELFKNPSLDVFWNLFVELESKVNQYNNSRRVHESLIWILASYLSWTEFEKVIIKIYESLDNDFKEEYLKYAIKYYLEIFETINNKKVRYTYTEFVNHWDDIIKIEFENELQAKHPSYLFKPSPTSGGVYSPSKYMMINTTEERFLSYSLTQKVQYLINFLENNGFDFFHFDALVTVIKVDNDKENILSLFRKRKNESKYIDLILTYFEADPYKNQLIKNFDSLSLNEESFNEIFDLIKDIFKRNYLLVFFVFFYNSIEDKLSKKIKNLFFICERKNKIDIFQNFYNQLKNIFNDNYFEIWKISNEKLWFFDSYRWLYFKLMALFVEPDEIFLKLQNQLANDKTNFIKNYFDNIELVVFNNWSFKEIYKSENELSLWMTFFSFIYWNKHNWEYAYWKYIPWFLNQKNILDKNVNKEKLFLQLAKTTDASLNLKNILNFGNVSYIDSLPGQGYCKINLFLSYIKEEEQMLSSLEYIKNNLDFYFSDSLRYETIMVLLDDYLRINISENKKEKIGGLLKIVFDNFSQNNDIEEEPYFSDIEKEQMAKKEFYNLGDKIVFHILNFHMSSLEEINKWDKDKKYALKLLLQYDHTDSLEIHLLKRYMESEQVKEKIELIENYFN